jgi:hypothetical protein
VRLRTRLAHLERTCTQASAPSLACVDEAGSILDDGTAETRPWIGKRQDDLPFPVQVLLGVDPLVALGLASDERERNRGALS